MTYKLDANISFMFKESPCLLERYKAASKAGFKGVECADEVYQYTIEELVQAKNQANVEQVVILGYGGAKNALAAIPGKEDDFKKSLATSLDYALALNCKKLHICSGITNPDGNKQTEELYSAYEETYVNNLKYSSLEARKVGVTILIEPITTIPGYFLTDTKQAVNILKKLDCDNVKLELDFFHAQRSHGNLTSTLKEYFSYLGHIQVSQVPERGEPNSPGEINYSYIFELLRELGYNMWIGCEYIPQGKTEDGLMWLDDYGLKF